MLVTPVFRFVEPDSIGGKIREILSARARHPMVMIELIGSVERGARSVLSLGEGAAVSVSLDPRAIHVILADRSL